LITRALFGCPPRLNLMEFPYALFFVSDS
jgi:hypothetical protein